MLALLDRVSDAIVNKLPKQVAKPKQPDGDRWLRIQLSLYCLLFVLVAVYKLAASVIGAGMRVDLSPRLGDTVANQPPLLSSSCLLYTSPSPRD